MVYLHGCIQLSHIAFSILQGNGYTHTGNFQKYELSVLPALYSDRDEIYMLGTPYYHRFDYIISLQY